MKVGSTTVLDELTSPQVHATGVTPLRPPAKGWGSGQKSGHATASACPESTHKHHKPTKTARFSSPQKHTVRRCFTEAYAVFLIAAKAVASCR